MIKIKNIKKDFNEDTKIHLKDFEFENEKLYAILGVSGLRKDYPSKYVSRDNFWKK